MKLILPLKFTLVLALVMGSSLGLDGYSAEKRLGKAVRDPNVKCAESAKEAVAEQKKIGQHVPVCWDKLAQKAARGDKEIAALKEEATWTGESYNHFKNSYANGGTHPNDAPVTAQEVAEARQEHI